MLHSSHISFFSLLIFICAFPALIVNAQKAAIPGKMIRPLWIIDAFIAGPYAAMSDEQAKSFLSKSLDMDETYITFDGETCSGLNFVRREDTLSEYYVDTYAIIRKTTGYTRESITVVQTDCTIKGFDEFVRLLDRRLIVQRDGVYWVFSPNINY